MIGRKKEIQLFQDLIKKDESSNEQKKLFLLTNCPGWILEGAT